MKINNAFDLKGSSYWNSWNTIYIRKNVSVDYIMKGCEDVSFRLVLVGVKCML